MPTEIEPVVPIIRLYVAVGAGAPQAQDGTLEGGIVIDVDDVIHLSVVGDGIYTARWELTAFPPDFTCPAGWSTASNGVYYVVTNGSAPPSFAADKWGKFLPRVTTNNGIRSGRNVLDQTDARTGFQSYSPTGLEDIAYGEGAQFHPRGKWVPPLQAAFRVLDLGLPDPPSFSLPNNPSDDGKVGIALGGAIVWTPGTNADDVLGWSGTAWVSTPRAGLTINSFAATAPIVEVGTSVVTPAFTASYNVTPDTAVLTDNAGGSPKDVHATPTSFTSNGTVVRSTSGQTYTYTLTATKAAASAVRTTTITWGQKNWWGVGAAGGNSEAFIEALSGSALGTARTASFTLSPGASQYVYFACRAAYGTPVFKDHATGFAVAMTLVSSTISVTNAHGITENYQLWVSDNPNLGSITVDVT